MLNQVILDNSTKIAFIYEKCKSHHSMQSVAGLDCCLAVTSVVVYGGAHFSFNTNIMMLVEGLVLNTELV